MYIAKQFAQTDTNILHDLINAKPLATWITQYADGELIVDHLPFILDPDRGEFGTLISHVSKANPLWKRFANSTQSICVFHGVDGYISPTWYVDSKSEHGKAVPTWNYVTVHVYGQAKLIDDLEETSSRMLRHKNEYFYTFFKTTISYSESYSPILMTKAVYDGYKSANPNADSIKNGWFSKKSINVRDYSGDIYGGDVIKTAVEYI